METLISSAFVDFTHPFLEDGVLKVFLHKTVQPVGFVEDLLAETDRLVAFSIKRVKKKKHAEVVFQEFDVIDHPTPGVVGLATPLLKPQRWHIAVEKETTLPKHFIYAHEFGHALGLEHPFDDFDGDAWENATTNDTVMSYSYVPSANWMWRPADRDALTGLYG